MKKKITFLLVLGLVLMLIAGCSAVTKMVTGAVITSFMESDDGPKQVIDEAFSTLLSDLVAAEYNINNIEDYNWSLSDSSVEASVDSPPDNTTGILVAKNIRLDYTYTITGTAKAGSGQNDIVKEGQLKFNIAEVVYNESTDNLVSMTTAVARYGAYAPYISNIETSAPPVEFSAFLSNILGHDPRAVTVVGYLDSETLEIENNSVIYESHIYSDEAEMVSLAVLNRDILANPNIDETGLAIAIFAVEI